MKAIKLFLVVVLSGVFLTSCDNYREDIDPGISLNQLLGSYELWYVDINATLGYGETPWLQKAFTLSFRNGVLYANNNIAGIGETGNGFGIDVGVYDAYQMILDVDHDVDGFSTYDVYQISANRIELYNPDNDTSYFLDGYQRSNFDYDFIFYDNIHYFLQDYEAWEKIFTSNTGATNPFDAENYLRFLAGGNDETFQSSQDAIGLNPNQVFWDYTGVYGVGDVANDFYLKTLTLNYDQYGNEFFELSVIDDETISLYQPSSNTTYEFAGRGYIQYIKATDTKTGKTVLKEKKRKFKKERKDNPRDSSRVL
ncbi:nicotinic acid mononucleotide adenyltransferase [Pseudotamlana carrageenivorans]|uniref:Nicotinic acid mononucleotide adenyltransferase n=1 Tax=Pseudotamlana carrageenivorans TaxID=2069432 RepID=A0A2I7SFZ0_9FLAO|nr:nicotinic acid mononucleotide adenyltransferase [Tamlana carrageenivorans]AUS04823.1 nicotinic acid mononucleotide adenyltransferase [Tamlana carrageenivorans]